MFLVPHPELFWVLVALMYIAVSFQILPSLADMPFIVATSLTSIMISSALSFKLAFTVEDAPELVVGFARKLHDMFEGQSLLLRARIVFAVIAILSCYAIYQAKTGGIRSIRASGKI